jgi:hypothetical protein
MQVIVNVPDGTPLPFIVAALMPFGAEVIEDQAPALPRVSSSPRKPKAKRETQEYRELIYTRPDGNGGQEQCEMDGVEVAQRIRRIMAERAAAWRHDGRSKSHFKPFDPEHGETPDDYIRRFCSGLSHVPTQYTNGVTA